MVSCVQVASCPELIWNRVAPARTPVANTATGTLLLVLPLLPSWSPVPSPQQYAVPALPSAHAKLVPTVTWVRIVPAGIAPRDTATAVVCGVLVVLPFPSSPSVSSPQQ